MDKEFKRKFVKGVVIVCVLYFFIGLIISISGLSEKFEKNIFQQYASLVGGIASVFGLLSLANPSISSADKGIRDRNIKESCRFS